MVQIQENCYCGHAKSKHHASKPTHPCTVKGCECGRYQFDDSDATQQAERAMERAFEQRLTGERDYYLHEEDY